MARRSLAHGFPGFPERLEGVSADENFRRLACASSPGADATGGWAPFRRAQGGSVTIPSPPAALHGPDMTMMTCLPIVLGALLTGQAQPEDPIADKLAAFAPMLGSWSGAGTYTDEEGEPGSWTVTLHAERALDGHAVIFDSRVLIEGQEEPRHGHAVYSVDGENGELVKLAFASDMKGPRHARVTWTDPQTLVESITHRGENGLGTGRNVWRFDGDRLEWTSDRCMGAAPFGEGARGTLTRTEPTPLAVEASYGKGKGASPEMNRLAELSGHFRVTGAARDMDKPGEMRRFSGTQSLGLVLGGQVLRWHWAADPDEDGRARQGTWYLVWNAEARIYDSYSVWNGGGLTRQIATLADDGSLTMFSRWVDEGTVYVERVTRVRRKDGAWVMRNHATRADGAAHETWSLVSTPVE